MATAHLKESGRRSSFPITRKYMKSVFVAVMAVTLFPVPSVVVILLIPFIANIWISLHSWRGGRSKMKFIGLDNYVKLLGDEKFWTSFSNSLYMIVAMVIIPLLIGLILAAVLFDYIGREFRW